MEQSPSWEANRFSASKEISGILWNPKVHYPNHKCSLFDCAATWYLLYGEELLASRPNPKLEDHPLSDVRYCFLQYIRSYPPYWRPFLHRQPEDSPCRCDGDPLITEKGRILPRNIAFSIFKLKAAFPSEIVVTQYQNTRPQVYSYSRENPSHLGLTGPVVYLLLLASYSWPRGYWQFITLLSKLTVRSFSSTVNEVQTVEGCVLCRTERTLLFPLHCISLNKEGTWVLSPYGWSTLKNWSFNLLRFEEGTVGSTTACPVIPAGPLVNIWHVNDRRPTLLTSDGVLNASVTPHQQVAGNTSFRRRCISHNACCVFSRADT